MNRHERRAAEARARARAAGKDKGFDAFVRQARRSFSQIPDRTVGEAWMRGQAWEASGADAMVIHPTGQPRGRLPDDMQVSLSYGALRFKAFIAPTMLREAVEGWGKLVEFVIKEAAKEGTHASDQRHVTRCCIIEWLIDHAYVDGDTAALLTSAVLWLATTTPAGQSIGDYKSVHYEITDILDPTGRKGNNFRLVLGQEQDEPIPGWVNEVPSPHGKPDV